MTPEAKVRVTRKNTLYIPKAIAEVVGIQGGCTVKLRVKGSNVILEVLQDPFDLALKGSKFAKTTFSDFERVRGVTG